MNCKDIVIVSINAMNTYDNVINICDSKSSIFMKCTTQITVYAMFLNSELTLCYIFPLFFLPFLNDCCTSCNYIPYLSLYSINPTFCSSKAKSMRSKDEDILYKGNFAHFLC